MLIRSINPTQNENVEKISKRNNANFKAGINPEVVKNKFRISFSQNIGELSQMVRLPKSQIEKEALLEVLSQRAKLETLFRLTNEKFKTLASIDLYNEFADKNESKALELKKELDKKGNLNSYLNSLAKRIKLEKSKNIEAINYFKEIDNIEEKYLNEKVITKNYIDKEYHDIRKNNINKDDKYTTKELFEIISKHDPETANVEVKKTIPISCLSKAQLNDAVDVAYDNILREEVDIYQGYTEHGNDARRARKRVIQKYIEAIRKYPDVQNGLVKKFVKIEEKFAHKVDKLIGVEIYPLSDHWKQMEKVEADIKELMTAINELKAQFKEESENSAIDAIIKGKEKQLSELKQSWVDGMMISIGSEAHNRQAFEEAGVLNDYMYLIEKNPTLLKHSVAFNVYKEGNQTIPDELWEQLVKPSKEFVQEYK